MCACDDMRAVALKGTVLGCVVDTTVLSIIMHQLGMALIAISHQHCLECAQLAKHLGVTSWTGPIHWTLST